jgi:hypothetical protein
LDTLPRGPSSDVLSAHYAKDRLREIVEGFFSRLLRSEEGERVGRLLVKRPTTCGKSIPRRR